MFTTPWIRLIAGAALAFVATVAGAAQPPVKGKEYELVQPPMPAEAPARKVEVLEFFFYGCPHCYNLQGPLKDWLKTAKDIELRRMPTIFGESAIPMARAFYALDAIGAVDKVHNDLFSEIHDRNNKAIVTDKTVFFDWAAKKGVDRAKLVAAYDSFAVDGKTKRAIQLTKSYGISGTPSVVVDGKFLTAPSMTGSYDRFFKVLDELIAEARRTQAPKKG